MLVVNVFNNLARSVPGPDFCSYFKFKPAFSGGFRLLCIAAIPPFSDADIGINLPNTGSEYLMLLCVLLKDFSSSSRHNGKLQLP